MPAPMQIAETVRDNYLGYSSQNRHFANRQRLNQAVDKGKRGPGLATRPCEQTAIPTPVDYLTFKRQNSLVPEGVMGQGGVADGTSL